jgi:hypothetical protein
MQYIYLHGFASSPQSYKAQYLRDRFWEEEIDLQIPDLNQGDFAHLTLSRQIEQTKSLFLPQERPVTIIGSSFGGLTAAWLGEKYPQVQRLILLAPAFGFLNHWLSKLSKREIQSWQESGYSSIYHYGEKRSLALHYQFIVDCDRYDESQLQKSLPTFIFHGCHDEVIPIQASRDYANQRPWVKLVELESDHSLGEPMPEIWQQMQQFLFARRYEVN